MPAVGSEFVLDHVVRDHVIIIRCGEGQGKCREEFLDELLVHLIPVTCTDEVRIHRFRHVTGGQDRGHDRIDDHEFPFFI